MLIQLSLHLSDFTSVLLTYSLPRMLHVLQVIHSLLVSFDRPCPSATPPRCLLHLLRASAPWGLLWLKIETPILRRDAISSRRIWRSRRNSQRDSFGALYTLLSAGMWLLFDRESINKVFSFGRWAGGIWRLTDCVFPEWAAFCWSETPQTESTLRITGDGMLFTSCVLRIWH